MRQRRLRLVLTTIIAGTLAAVLSIPHLPDEPLVGEAVTGARLSPPEAGLPSQVDSLYRFKEKPGDDYPAPQIAIIIDDFGHGWKRSVVEGFLDLPYEVTISIIPGSRHSVSTGRIAVRKGKEVFIHLPMEPETPTAIQERSMLMAHASQSDVAQLVDAACKELPMATGVNNHMGSKATLDGSLMEQLSRELNRHGLMFVDSRTVAGSKALNAMRQLGVPALGRDVFLDYDPDSLAVERSFDHLAAIAARRGWAVGIGHVRAGTLAILKRRLPQLEAEGIVVVPVSRLITRLRGPATARLDTTIAGH
ncbi:MAG: divergent polysaccharide deacetylase family protein [Calditrichaeota bacterium]|nr:divergent polysaccharide deacetylase family protein [Calditrichota bacterium]